jgi:O-antigen ligase
MMRVRPKWWYDALGAGLVLVLAAWIVVSALVQTGNPWPQVAIVGAATISYAAGRVLGGRRAVSVLAIVVVIILVGIVAGGPSTVSGGPVVPPLGYANANGAVFVIGAAAALAIATVADQEPVRRVGGVLGVILVGITLRTESRAAAVLAIGVLLVAVAAHRLRRWVVWVGPLFILATVTVTVGLGLTHTSPRFSPLVEGLSELRTQLWREALEISAAEPVFGVGPGMFAQASPSALADSDTRWAHSAYLQAAAEIGIVGVVLLSLVLLWVFGALYRSWQDLRFIVIGTAAATAVAVQAAIDYLAHFPVVMIVAALFTGLASSRAQLRQPPAAAS